MFHSIHQARAKLDRRVAVIALLLAGLLGTGWLSLAALNDTLTITNNFSVIDVNLRANASETLTFNYQFDGDGNDTQNKLVTMSNGGNVELRYALSSTATGTAANKIQPRVYLVTTAGNCPATNSVPTGTELTNGTTGLASASFGSAATGAQVGDRVLAVGASEMLCLSYFNSSSVNQLLASDTAQQVMTFAAEYTGS